ncbi:MAG: hypothetical protein U9O98_05040 [Asgard group archaeon]|nr:hypothetical protein [Asgard group archaeon]
MSTINPKKKSSQKRRKKLGPWFQVGRVLVIIGSILIIIAAILDMIDHPTASEAWRSYTFGWLDVPILPGVLAIVFAAIILWLILDARFINSMHIVVFAILVIVLAIIAGNVGALVVILGAILFIFEYIARTT